MKTLGPRNSTISSDPVSAAKQNGENARDTTLALQGKLSASIVTVERYTAVGSTDARIPLTAADRPAGVLLLTVELADARGDAVPVYGTPGFYWEATTRSVNAFEPTGLAANTVYRLSFILVEV